MLSTTICGQSDFVAKEFSSFKTSDYTDKKFLEKYKEKVSFHSNLFLPFLDKVFGEVKEKKLLDVGCGDGSLSKHFANLGAQVIGVDNSRQWIDSCKKDYAGVKGLEFKLADATDLSAFPDASFDFVLLSMVLIHMDSPEKVQKTIFECERVLKSDGVFAFSDLHPVLVMTKEVHPRYQRYEKDFSYLRDGSNFIAGMWLSKKKRIEFKDKHWTPQFYFKCLKNAGLFVDEIAELAYGKESPKEFQKIKIPDYLFFVCKKRK